MALQSFGLEYLPPHGTEGFLSTVAIETLVTVVVVRTANDTAATPAQCSCYRVDGALRGGVPRPGFKLSKGKVGIRSTRNSVVRSAAPETRRARWRPLELSSRGVRDVSIAIQSTPWSVVLTSLVFSACRA